MHCYGKSQLITDFCCCSMSFFSIHGIFLQSYVLLSWWFVQRDYEATGHNILDK